MDHSNDCSMLNPFSLLSGKLIPAIDHGDLKRVWLMMAAVKRERETAFSDESEKHGISFNKSVIEQEIQSPVADSLAVFARITVINYLLDAAFLEEWRKNDQPDDRVFETAAVFPLPNGVQGFAPDEFMIALRSK